MFGIPITESIEYDIITFNKLLRDAICLKLKETEEGRQYLYDCWRFKQTEPDIESLKKFKNDTTSKVK